MDLPTDKRVFVGYTFGTSLCVVLVILGLKTMVNRVSSDIVKRNTVFTEWCSKYEDSSLCRRSNDTKEIIPAPASQFANFYQRLEALEVGYLRIQQEVRVHDNILSTLDERLKKLEKSHALSNTLAVELALESLQHSSKSISSRLDSELASISRDLESIGERIHQVENHVSVSEDLSDQ